MRSNHTAIILDAIESGGIDVIASHKGRQVRIPGDRFRRMVESGGASIQQVRMQFTDAAWKELDDLPSINPLRD